MELFVYAVLYAFFGWLIEVTYYVFKTKSFVNRGFLNGPFVPIYGLSLLSLHVILYTIFDGFSPLSWVMVLSVFILIIVIGTVFELVGGMVLFNVFETRWWDYSDQPLNYKGYVCLWFSVIWGFLGTGGFFIIHVPLIVPWVGQWNRESLVYFTYGFSIILLTDYLFTLYSLFNFRRLVFEFKSNASQLIQSTSKFRDKLPLSISQPLETLRKNERLNVIMYNVYRAKDAIVNIKDKMITNQYSRLDRIGAKIRSTRLYKAFPELRIHKKQKDDHDE